MKLTISSSKTINPRLDSADNELHPFFSWEHLSLKLRLNVLIHFFSTVLNIFLKLCAIVFQ